jgi:hypothetical protein
MRENGGLKEVETWGRGDSSVMLEDSFGPSIVIFKYLPFGADDFSFTPGLQPGDRGAVKIGEPF